jgi:PsbP
VSSLSATAVGLAANFLGSTSAILALLPESTVERTGLDTYYPRAGFKRHNSKLYTFVIPQEWVGDTALELQKVQLRAKPLEYSMRSARFVPPVLPDVGKVIVIVMQSLANATNGYLCGGTAFGPPGRVTGRDVSSADTNVSVIVSNVLPGFSLEGTLGTPEQAADYLLKGMKRDISLIAARLDDQRSVYELEYQVNRNQGADSLRCISVIGFIASTNTLITQTVVAPASRWTSGDASKLRKIASSFRLKVPRWWSDSALVPLPLGWLSRMVSTPINMQNKA